MRERVEGGTAQRSQRLGLPQLALRLGAVPMLMQTCPRALCHANTATTLPASNRTVLGSALLPGFPGNFQPSMLLHGNAWIVISDGTENAVGPGLLESKALLLTEHCSKCKFCPEGACESSCVLCCL